MLRNKYSILRIIVLIHVLLACESQTYIDNEPTNNYVCVDDVIDLQGDTLDLSNNSILIFSKYGRIENGTIKGNNSQIIGSKNGIFNNVIIAGTWSVTEISTRLFLDIEKKNSLKNLFALASPEVHNTIIIEPGEYLVSVINEWGTALNVVSNTELIINGSINLAPNSYKGYQIINVSGDNISICGRGSIVGDKHTHLANDGEWGMGLNISNGNNIQVKDVVIKDCWGDCIYIGSNSNNIEINNCFLDHGRRQGISITSGDNISIKNSLITNVSGTAPEYGVDIEPNKNEKVGNVYINNVRVINCMGGFTCWCGAKNSNISRIVIENCSVEGTLEKSAYGWYKNIPVYMINCLEHGNIVEK